MLFAGDVEFKQNKLLPPEKQIVTANPDINTVCEFQLILFICQAYIFKENMFSFIKFVCFIHKVLDFLFFFFNSYC